LDPAADEETLIKSVYLSVGRFAEPADKERYRVELDGLGTEIKRGVEPAFVETELARLARQRNDVGAVRPLAAWGAVFRLFLPAMVLLALLFGLVFAMRLVG
jgi:hypothetical protein